MVHLQSLIAQPGCMVDSETETPTEALQASDDTRSGEMVHVVREKPRTRQRTSEIYTIYKQIIKSYAQTVSSVSTQQPLAQLCRLQQHPGRSL